MTRITPFHAGLAAIGVMACWMAARPTGAANDAGPKPDPAGVAVVEVFTSQGCSSCPAAERVVADLNAAARSDGRPVFTLAFHVDYWDHGGWRDPFSSAAFSARQQDYAATLHLNQVYTPQMVVNGRTEFVGSDRPAADAAIASARAVPAAVPVTLSAVTRDSTTGGYRVHFAAPAAADGQVVHVAVVEQGLSKAVKGGENAGAVLDQPSVVRWFGTVPAAAAGDVVVPPLPAGARADRSTVVAYVQRPADGAILGAASAKLP